MKRSFQQRDWEGLCTEFRVGRVFGKLLLLRGGEKQSEDIFRGSKTEMGVAQGSGAENILTWVVEFPILQRHQRHTAGGDGRDRQPAVERKLPSLRRPGTTAVHGQQAVVHRQALRQRHRPDPHGREVLRSAGRTLYGDGSEGL